MTRPAVVAALAALAGCALPDPGPAAKTWTVADFVSAARAGKDFAGIDAAGLVAFPGEPIAWRALPFQAEPSLQGAGVGLTVLPAFADGLPAAWTATEIRYDHPAPWVQPVYLPVTAFDPAKPASNRLGGAHTVFGAGAAASFYSPFWRLQVVVVPADTAPDALRDVRSMLAAALEVHDGPLVLCPIVPDGTGLAREANAAAPQRPLTLEPLNEFGLRTASVDGVETPYVDFGADRFEQTDHALVVEAPLYVFVNASGEDERAPLPLPFVLPKDPFRHSLLRRVDLVFTSNLAVFVPAAQGALRADLLGRGLNVPAADATIPAATSASYALRVASDASCFGDAGRFPGGCAWLDSQDAVESAVARHNLLRTDTLFTGATLRVGTVVR